MDTYYKHSVRNLYFCFISNPVDYTTEYSQCASKYILEFITPSNITISYFILKTWLCLLWKCCQPCWCFHSFKCTQCFCCLSNIFCHVCGLVIQYVVSTDCMCLCCGRYTCQPAGVPECGRWLCLPDEVWLSILSVLPHSDLCRVVQVCRRLHTVATDHTLCTSLYCTLLSDLSLLKGDMFCL